MMSLKKTAIFLLMLMLMLVALCTADDGTWRARAPMPTARQDLASAVVNGKIYAIGGGDSTAIGSKGFSTVEEYDPVTNIWRTMSNMPTPRDGLAAVTLNGKIYVMGGYNGGPWLNTVEQYDPVSNSWRAVASMQSGRNGLAAAVVNGKIYAIGGYDGNSHLETVEEYNPATNTWRRVADMPTGRNLLAAAVVNDKIYAIGGFDGVKRLDTVEEYNPSTDTWQKVANMPTARSDVAAAVVNGKIYVIGGEDSTRSSLDTVEEYNPIADAWRKVANMPAARDSLTAAVVNGRIYAIGGSGPISIVEEYTPPAGEIPVLPVITSISPNNGPATGGTEVTITGSNFASGASIRIGGSSASARSISETQIIAITPPGKPGPADVVVINPDQQMGVLKGGFRYTLALPVVEAGEDKAAQEGQTVTISATFTDDDLSDRHTAEIDWGDGVVKPGDVKEDENGRSGTVAGSHSYADNGRYTVKVTVTDSYGNLGSDTMTFTITNEAPKLAQLPNQNVKEGNPVVNVSIAFTDPGTLDTHNAIIRWGDDKIEVINPAKSPINASHTYPGDDGTYSVTVRVTDKDNGFESMTFTVTVENENPVLSDMPGKNASEGEPVSIIVSFSDPGTQDRHKASISWGDGKTDTIDPATSPISKTHIYLYSDVYTVRVTVTDDDNGSATGSFYVTVTRTGDLSLADTPWPMRGHDIRHTGQSPYKGPDTAGVKWKFKAGAGVSSSPCIGSDGTVYVGSYDKHLYAINPDGTLKWKFQTVDWVFSSPCIGSDGTVYVGSWTYLYAINLNGALRWKFQTGGLISSSPCIGSDGTVYVGSDDNYLYAINPDGTLRWKFQTGSAVYSSPCVGSDGTVYVGSWDSNLYAINPDGALRWKFKTGSAVYSSPCIGSDGTVYVGSWDNHLYAINPGGALRWKFQTGDSVYHSSPCIGSDGTVYVGSRDSYLYAINPDGTLRWKFKAGARVDSSPCIDSDGTVYVGSSDSYLYAIKPDGALRWRFKTGAAVASSPCIGSDGTVYVGSNDGYVYALGKLIGPVITLSHTEFGFGPVQVGTSKEMTLTISNIGDASLSVNSIISSSTEFAVSPISLTVEAGASQEVKVTFTPISAGSKSSTLTIASDDTSNPSATVSMTGLATKPVITLPLKELDFGSVQMGTSKVMTLTISNSGDALLSVSSISSSSTEFAVSPISLIVGADTSQEVKVTFRPSSAGSKSAILTIASNDPVNPSKTVSLTGLATKPVIKLSHTKLDFGSIQMGTSKVMTLTISNSGDALLSVSSISSDSPEFTVSPASLIVDIGLSQAVKVTFTPSSTGSKSATLTIQSNDPSNPSVTITLTASAGGGIRMSLPEVTADPGSTITVGISVDNAAGIAGGDVELTYDPKILTVKAARATILAAGLSLATTNLNIPGKVTFAIAGATGLKAGSGILLEVDFQVTATSGKSNLTLSSVELFDENINTIPVDVTNGSVTVKPAPPPKPRQLTIADAAGKLGDVIATAVSIDEVLSVAGGDIVLLYDKAILEVSEVKVTALLAGVSAAVNKDIPGKISISTASTTGAKAGSGAILDITFKAISSGVANITFESAALFNENIEGISVETKGGKITVKTPVPVISLSHTEFGFGSVQEGMSKEMTLTISNIGDASLSVNSIISSSTEFAVSPISLTVEAGASQEVKVTFTPISAGSKSSTLTIASDDTSNPSATVSMTGLATKPVIKLSHTKLDFGSIQMGTSKVMTLTISNSGDALLSVSSISSSSIEFAVSPASLTVGAGTSQEVEVTFTPTSAGSKSVVLTIASDDTSNPSATVSLSGLATRPVIIISLTELSFGSVQMGTSKGMTLTISNTGNAPLSVSSISSDSPEFTVSPTSFTVNAGLSQVVTITFTPTSTGSKSATLTIKSNDPNNPSTTVSLSASARGTGLADTPWPMRGHDVRHTGQSPYKGPDIAGVKWKFQTGSDFYSSSPSIGADGAVYVGSGSENGFHIYAINPDGTLRWKFQADFNDYSSPAICSDGVVYVGASGQLYAVNPDGSMKWMFRTGALVYSSPCIGSDGTVYVGSLDDYLYAINPDGSMRWKLQTGRDIHSSPAIGSDGTVYVGSGDFYLYAINTDGSVKWRFNAGAGVYSSPCIGSDGTVYVGSLDSYIYAINPDGNMRWKFKTGDDVRSSPCIGSDGIVYVGSDDSYLYAVNPDGSLRWKFQTGNAVFSSPCIGSDGAVYVGSHDSYLYAVNPDGSMKWKFKTGAAVSSSPCINSDGTVYVMSEDSYIYALGKVSIPVITLSQTELDFGSFWMGMSKGMTLTISNSGDAPLSVSSISSSNTQFTASPTSFTLNAGSSQVVTVTFRPSSAGSKRATLTIKSNDPNNPSITVSLSAIAWDSALADTPWPMRGHDVRHTGQSPYKGPDSARVMWKFQTGDNVYSSPCIGSDGTVYVGSGDNYLYAINPDGSLRWKFKTGNWVYSSPCIGSDGTVYVGSQDSYLYAINQDGALRWKFKTGDDVLSSPCIGSDGTVYVGSLDNHLYAVNPDGTLRWKFQTDAAFDSSPCIGSDGTVYVGSVDSYLYAVNPDGTLRWKFLTGLFVPSSPCVGLDGTIYVGSLDFHLYAADPDGALRWKFQTGASVESSPCIGSDGTVYVGSDDNYLYAIKPDGALRWKFQTGGWVSSSPCIGSDGTVYVGSHDSYLYAINPDGTLRWKFKTGDRVYSSPCIGSDGILYVGSYDNSLYALGYVPEPIITLSQTELDFGSFWTGMSPKQMTLTISNSGDAPLSVSNISSNNNQFTASPTSFILNAGSSQVVTVTFTLSSAGNKWATLTIKSDDPGKPSVTVSLITDPVIEFTDFSRFWDHRLDLGSVRVGTQKEMTLTISNTGGATLSVSSISSNSPEFIVSPTSLSIDAGKSKVVTITFKPLYTGDNAATLTIKSGDSINPSRTIALIFLSGSTPKPVIELSHTRLDFGSVQMGTPKQMELTISNTGDDTLSVSGISSSSAQFTASPVSLTVNAGSSKEVKVTFTPSTAGSKSATLTIKSNDPNNPSVTVSLSGSTTKPVIKLSHAELDFGSVQAGTSKQMTLTISNTGDASLSITSINSNLPEFTVSPASLTVNAGSSKDVKVTFTPSSAGSKSARLTVASNDPSNLSVTISLAGLAVEYVRIIESGPLANCTIRFQLHSISVDGNDRASAFYRTDESKNLTQCALAGQAPDGWTQITPSNENTVDLIWFSGVGDLANTVANVTVEVVVADGAGNTKISLSSLPYVLDNRGKVSPELRIKSSRSLQNDSTGMTAVEVYMELANQVPSGSDSWQIQAKFRPNSRPGALWETASIKRVDESVGSDILIQWLSSLDVPEPGVYELQWTPVAGAEAVGPSITTAHTVATGHQAVQVLPPGRIITPGRAGHNDILEVLFRADGDVRSQFAIYDLGGFPVYVADEDSHEILPDGLLRYTWNGRAYNQPGGELAEDGIYIYLLVVDGKASKGTFAIAR